MHAFDILGDPVRRRILELLAADALTSGQVVERIQAEFGISQSAVSQHLALLRTNGFANATPQGTKRIYALDTTGLRAVDEWLAPFREYWAPKLEALATEVARGKRRSSS